MDHQQYLSYAKQIVDNVQEEGAILRLLGSVAFYLHCPDYGHFQQQAGRDFTDLDFAAYYDHSEKIRRTFKKLELREDRETAVVYARSRLVYDKPDIGLHVDVFFDKLDFCHPIYWKHRLELDSPTIPLAELLLEKMQIVKINEKDIIDTIMLMREHQVNNSDNETINGRLIADLCANDWGLWRTVTMNLNKVHRLAKGYPWLKSDDYDVVSARIKQLLNIIDTTPKTLSWKVRDKVGDRVKWYKDVSEVTM
jgi:hypothetical protein